MASYAYYCLHELKILPSKFLKMDSAEKAFIIASINRKSEIEKKQRAKMKKK